MFSSKTINDQSIPVSTPKPKPKSENVAPPDLYKIIHPEVDEMDLQYFTLNVLYKYLQSSSFAEAKKKVCRYCGSKARNPPHRNCETSHFLSQIHVENYFNCSSDYALKITPTFFMKIITKNIPHISEVEYEAIFSQISEAMNLYWANFAAHMDRM